MQHSTNVGPLAGRDLPDARGPATSHADRSMPGVPKRAASSSKASSSSRPLARHLSIPPGEFEREQPTAFAPNDSPRVMLPMRRRGPMPTCTPVQAYKDPLVTYQ